MCMDLRCGGSVVAVVVVVTVDRMVLSDPRRLRAKDSIWVTEVRSTVRSDRLLLLNYCPLAAASSLSLSFVSFWPVSLLRLCLHLLQLWRLQWRPRPFSYDERADRAFFVAPGPVTEHEGRARRIDRESRRGRECMPRISGVDVLSDNCEGLRGEELTSRSINHSLSVHCRLSVCLHKACDPYVWCFSLVICWCMGAAGMHSRSTVRRSKFAQGTREIRSCIDGCSRLLLGLW